MIFWTATAGMVLAGAMAFCLPAEYTSTVKVITNSDRQDILSDFSGLTSVFGLNLNSLREGQEWDTALYPELVGSTPFLSVMSRNGMLNAFAAENRSCSGKRKTSFSREDTEPFHPDPYDPSPCNHRIVKEFRRWVRVETDNKTGLTTVSVTLRHPEQAAAVAAQVVRTLEQYLVDHRTRKARNDLDFFAVRFDEAKAKYYAAQQAYADYSDANRHVAREAAAIERERLYQEQQLAYSLYSQLAGQLEMARLKVQEQTPVLTVIEPAQIPVAKSSPHRVFIVLGGMLVGLFLASFLVCARFIFRRKEA